MKLFHDDRDQRWQRNNTFRIIVYYRTNNTWQIQHEAARAGLLTTEVTPCDLDELLSAGYAPTGRRGGKHLGKNRQARGLVAHVLSREDDRCRSVAPLSWLFDNSFWLDQRLPDEEQAIASAQKLLEVGQVRSE